MDCDGYSLGAAMEPSVNQCSFYLLSPTSTQRGLHFDGYLDYLEHYWEIVIHVWVGAKEETVSHLSSISQPSYINRLSMQDSYLVYESFCPCVVPCIWMWEGLPPSLKDALHRAGWLGHDCSRPTVQTCSNGVCHLFFQPIPCSRWRVYHCLFWFLFCCSAQAVVKRLL